MSDKTQKNKKKREQALFEIVEDAIGIYTAPRYSDVENQDRKLNVTGVKILAYGLLVTAQESYEQKRGVRVEVLIQFDLLPALASLLVKLQQDHLGTSPDEE